MIIIGAGLSGLVAANELAERGIRVMIIDQEGEQNLGGQAFWSFVLVPRQLPVTKTIGHKGQPRTRHAGLDGYGRL